VAAEAVSTAATAASVVDETGTITVDFLASSEDSVSAAAATGAWVVVVTVFWI
jgi:hypothetical protein